MNTLKIQQDLLAAAMRSRGADSTGSVRWQNDPHGRGICLFHRAYVGYFIQPRDLYLNLTMLPTFDKPLPYGFACLEVNRIKPTSEVQLFPNNRKVRVFQGGKGRTGIDQALLRHFDKETMKLYQLEPQGPILVVERQHAEDITVGIVMPCRI